MLLSHFVTAVVVSFNEVLTDWENLFVMTSVRYIEVVFYTFHYYWAARGYSPLGTPPGVLPIKDYTGILRPKGVPFSG